jgi:GNAT superfamily N-acetyltransferase
MAEVEVRAATKTDAALIHRLLSDLEFDLGVTGDVQRSVQDIEQFGFSEPPFFHTLIAWKGSDAVGLAVYFREFSTWRGTPGVYVQDLYVSAKMRSTGLGWQLMEAVFAQARVWGASYCKLSVYDENDAAIAFYERLGFQVRENEQILLLELD